MAAINSRRLITHLSIALLLSPLAEVCIASPSGAKTVVAAATPIAGRTQGQWSARWWQWAYSFDDDESPLGDEKSDLCGAGQQGAVWFLAGTYESAPITRRCVVPAGKYLFFPIVNLIASSTSEQPLSCQALIQNSKHLADQASQLTLIVDGEVVPNINIFRQVSPSCFNAGELVQENVLSAANGYFVMLEPLSPGKHVLKWGGVIDDFRQAVVYELNVKSGP